MNHDDLEATVHRLLLQSLGGLDISCDEDWTQGIEQLCMSLLQLDAEPDLTLATVVRAAIVVQHFLLALVAPPPEGPSRRAIIDAAARLLSDLHSDDHDAADDERRLPQAKAR